MNNYINLIISSGNSTFQAKLQQVDQQSQDSVTIGGKHYKIMGDVSDDRFQKLANYVKDFSSVKFGNLFEFKQKLNLVDAKFTVIDDQSDLLLARGTQPTRVNKISQARLADVQAAIGSDLQPLVKDRNQLRAIREQAQQGLRENLPASQISHSLCEGIKSLMARMYDEGVKHLQKQGFDPPCEYCVVGLGSLARDEAGPYPDFDNFIVVKQKTPEIENYFLKLNQYVADRVYRLGESLEGNKPGLRFCWGNLNPQHQPYDLRYSATPTYRGRSDLLVAPSAKPTTVRLGDVRDGVPFCGSNLSLYETYKKTTFPAEAARSQVRADMERQVKGLTPNPDNPPAPITADKLPALVHVKEDLCRLPAASIGALALYHGITAPTTLGRIEALKSAGLLDPELADRLTVTMDLLVKWRIQAQSAYGEEFEFIASSLEALDRFKEELPQQIDALDKRIASLEAAVPRDDFAINNAKGQREFAIDCQNWMVERIKLKPSAFSEADRIRLREIVLPTLRELYGRVSHCLSGSNQEIDPEVFQSTAQIDKRKQDEYLSGLTAKIKKSERYIQRLETQRDNASGPIKSSLNTHWACQTRCHLRH